MSTVTQPKTQLRLRPEPLNNIPISDMLLGQDVIGLSSGYSLVVHVRCRIREHFASILQAFCKHFACILQAFCKYFANFFLTWLKIDISLCLQKIKPCFCAMATFAYFAELRDLALSFECICHT